VGPAGCVLASRLSEDPSISVLLLESGPVLNSWSSRVPLLSTDYQFKSTPAYKWASTPIQCLKGRTLQMVPGKAMGGTSKINGSMYTRSTPGDYNAWALDGRKGWSCDEVEPYFNGSEKSPSHGKSPHRGSNGKQHA
jgi:choline dehydrogenase